MTPAALLIEGFSRIRSAALAALDGLDEGQLAHRPAPAANSIAWLVWHLARVQDDHLADVAGIEQVWTAQGYAGRFDLGIDPVSIGYAMSSADVARVCAPAELLAAYAGAVHDQSVAYLATLTSDDLDRVVDEHWDPPVTLGVRLMSVLNDDLQHVGQAAYVRGLLGC